MNYGRDLEGRLKVSNQITELESSLDNFFCSWGNPETFLKGVKIFLGKNKPYRNSIFKGTLLRGSDCITMDSLASILGSRKGYDFQIVRPIDLIHLFHTALRYESQSNVIIFNIAGSTEFDSYSVLTCASVAGLLKTVK